MVGDHHWTFPSWPIDLPSSLADGESHLTSFSELLRQLDWRERIRGRQFERICRWYLETAPEYRSRFRRVWLWADWPAAWAPDAGIDLVAEEHGGGLW